METDSKNHLKTGLFIAGGLVIICLSILMVGGERWFLTSKSAVYADFSEVQGLANGSVVSLSGLTIGNIESIEYKQEQNILKVKMKIETRYMSMIPKDSSVEIRTQGALGDKFVFIQPGDIKTGILEDEGTLVAKKSQDLMGILSERGKDAEKIFEIINELYLMTKSINGNGRLDQTLENVSLAAKDMRATAQEAQKMFKDIKLAEASNKLDRIMTKLDKGEGTLGALINDPSVHESLKEMLGAGERKKAVRSLIRKSIKEE